MITLFLVLNNKKEENNMPTRKDNFNAILNLINDKDLIDFIKNEINAIDKHNAMVKTTRSKTCAANDELTDKIANIVGSDYMTINQIIDACQEPDLTQQQIVYRCTVLVNDGIFEKKQKNINGKRLVVYRHK